MSPLMETNGCVVGWYLTPSAVMALKSPARIRSKLCQTCPVFSSQDANSIEGILLIDNSESKEPIDENTITILSVIAHAVGVAINNSKTYSSVLRIQSMMI